ncbi:CPBP family intramembrane glutamic endopeptidase [Mucilaginibacter gotjawali]|uniref:Membrane protease YdiL (CAAX protease family) n=2 Tax=Mucilaginibacter gotjawali TaxID=1550579 RepID=A0A839SLM7_9SPHI|nr:CPBP family intramembrane glutamic endopeptidase [Mucilaginibacter gotjawali]MBB3058223.1 membrane protease YdiL (CAAX protease family) [Mucilaginibacter gotjawali]BAU54821.1 CAAX amino terminal protease self- immunity [Mucilaginibacter gotjawali]
MLPLDDDLPGKKPCIQCGTLIALDGKFCNQCGARQSAQNANAPVNSWGLLQQAGLFFGIDIIVCVLGQFVEALKTFSFFLFSDIVMAISAVLFFSLNWKENKSLLKWHNFSWQKLAAYCAIAMAAQVLVHYSVDWLNLVVYSKDEDYVQHLNGSFAGGLLVVFFTAIAPAIFEELGYRGYLLQTLLKIADKEQAVYITSFLFAIIHMSFLSLFWLIPFALFLGFVRIKENTLWYGVFFHFCFNLTACIFELL